MNPAVWRVHVRAGVTVLVVATSSILRLPGPFWMETAIGILACSGLVYLGIRRGCLHGLTRSRRWQAWKWPLAMVAGAGALCAAGLMGWTTWRIACVVWETRSAALGGVEQLRAYKVETGTADLEHASALLQQLDDLLHGPGGQMMGAIPLVGQHRNYVVKLVGPLRKLVDEGVRFAQSRPDTALGVSSGRMNLGALSKLDKPLGAMADSTAVVVRAARHDRSPWLTPLLTWPVDKLVSKMATYEGTLRTTRRVARELPWLLGADSRRTYFVPVLSPVENRSGGGFPGAFAVISADKGRLSFDTYGPLNKVSLGGDALHRVIAGPDDFVARYQQYGAGDGVKPAQVWFWSNVTASPDHPSVSQVIAQLYPQSGGRKVDGVIAVDVRALADVLRLTGPVPLTGTSHQLSADNAEQYLLHDQYFELNRVSNEVRKDKLYSAAGAIATRLTTRDLPAASTVVRELGPAVRGGNIRMWFVKRSAQDLMRYLDADGAFGEPTSVASVAVTNTNGGPNKIDMFLKRRIDHQVRVDRDGMATVETTITLTNEAPSTGYDGYVLANMKGWPNGTNVTILNYYSPFVDCATTTDGKNTPMASELELGWVVHSMYMGVRPKSSTTVKVTCRGSLTQLGLGMGVPRIRGQVVANDDEWTARVVGDGHEWGFVGPLNSNKWTELVKTK